MATMNVSIPEPMKAWVEERARDGSFDNESDDFRHLIRRDQERVRAVAQVQAAITEGRGVIGPLRRWRNNSPPG